MMTKHVYKTIIFGAGQIGQMTARLLGNSYQIMCLLPIMIRANMDNIIGNIPICSPSKAAALLPDLIILGVLDEERRGSMMQQMEHLGYHGSFCDPSALRMFDARVAVMRLLAEQMHQQNIPGDVAELGVFRVIFLPDQYSLSRSKNTSF